MVERSNNTKPVFTFDPFALNYAKNVLYAETKINLPNRYVLFERLHCCFVLKVPFQQNTGAYNQFSESASFIITAQKWDSYYYTT